MYSCNCTFTLSAYNSARGALARKASLRMLAHMSPSKFTSNNTTATTTLHSLRAHWANTPQDTNPLSLRSAALHFDLEHTRALVRAFPFAHHITHTYTQLHDQLTPPMRKPSPLCSAELQKSRSTFRGCNNTLCAPYAAELSFKFVVNNVVGVSGWETQCNLVAYILYQEPDGCMYAANCAECLIIFNVWKMKNFWIGVCIAYCDNYADFLWQNVHCNIATKD